MKYDIEDMKAGTKPLRYIVFRGAFYYPGGGLHDMVQSFAALEEAVECASDWGKSPDYFAHVLDTETLEIVYDSEGD
ncbi:MAG: hypothetical protein HC850_14415 [Rhodomicrobium sp.]|nr:hypothetical protein [Rhodomicrobium sp.]